MTIICRLCWWIFVGHGGGGCGTEQSEAIVPSPRRALRTAAGICATAVVGAELERTNVPCPAVLAAVVEINGADSVFY